MVHSASYEFGVSNKLVIAIAILFLTVTQCATQSTAPKSRNAPWSASIGDGLPTKGPLVVLQSSDFQLSLELDANARCAIMVRRLYSNPVGRLVWIANYFAGTPSGSTKCTLTFTKDGDLQLHMFYRQQTLLSWSSKTALTGVTKMTLQDKGNFQLLTASRKAIFSSFDQKEFAIVDTQKLRYYADRNAENPWHYIVYETCVSFLALESSEDLRNTILRVTGCLKF